MPRPKIYLRVIREDDAFIVVDQDGRKVANARHVSVDATYNSATVASITFLDVSDRTGKPHTNSCRNSGQDYAGRLTEAGCAELYGLLD